MSSILEDTINAAIDAVVKQFHTSLPAKVLKFDKDTQTVDVQIQQKRLFTDGAEELPPPLIGVPIRMKRAGGFAITLPIEVGDTGLIVCTERSLDEWQELGSIEVPSDSRTHDLSDAVFSPDLWNKTNLLSNYSDNLELRTESGNGKISIAKSGKIELEKDGVKVLETISDTLQELSTTTVTVTSGSSAGTYVIDNQAAFTALKALIDGIRI